MKTIAFNIENATVVENAVCEVFDCRVSEIVSLKDTLVKKVVVFVLVKYFEIDKRVVGHQYQMTYLFVPTVVAELENIIKNAVDFQIKINKVYERIELKIKENAYSA